MRRDYRKYYYDTRYSGQLRTFNHTFIIEKPIQSVWNFYTDIKHLEIITPQEIDLKIINATSPNIVQGHELWVSGKLFSKRRMSWHSKITFFKPFEYIDEMISGPFKKWKHLHRFHDINGNQKTTAMTEVIDEIEFELPYGILGRIFEDYAYKQLQNTFEYRETATIRTLANK